MATAFLGYIRSPKWFKLKKNNNSNSYNNNNNNKYNNNKNNKELFKVIKVALYLEKIFCIILQVVISIYSCEMDNTFQKNTPFSKCSVRRFSTFSRSIKPKESDYNSVQQYSKDVIDFLKNNNLKPVYIYENLCEKSIQNKVLNDTRNIAGVYLILNKATLSCYVGSASTNKLNAKFRKHLFNFSGSKIVKTAVRKYKIDNFAFMILQVFPEVVTKENNKKLLDLEDYYIKSLLPDYNIVTEAGNTFGYKHSEITRIKMVENFSLRRRLRIGDLNTSKSLSEEVKANMRAAALIRKKPIYSKQGLANMRKSSKPIIIYNLNKTVYGEYPNITAVAESLRCSVKTITRAMNTPKNILKRR